MNIYYKKVSGDIVKIKKLHENLTLVGSFIENNNRVCLVTCKVCSIDKELTHTGIFFASKGNLNKGSVPCFCSKSPNLSDWQYKILLERKLKNSCTKFIGFVEKCKGYNTKVKIFCSKHNIECSTTPLSNILKNKSNGCKYCGYDSTSHKNKIPDIENLCLKRGLESGSFIIGTEIKGSYYCNDKMFVNYTCPACSFDEYVKEGICSGVFKTSLATIGKGYRSCRCGERVNWSKEERVYQINKRIREENLPYSFIGFKEGQFSARLEFYYSCDIHGKQISSCKTFLNAKASCPSCAEFGYDKSKSAHIYLVRWECGEDAFCKVGITNNLPSKRISQQKSKTTFEPTHIEEFYHKDGRYIKDLENEIKQTFKCGVISQEAFPDGFTETVSLENYSPILELIKTRMET